MKTYSSEIHKDIHIASIAHARRVRNQGNTHARLLALAREARLFLQASRAGHNDTATSNFRLSVH